MVKNNGKREEKRKEVRENLICDKCGSRFVYVLANGEIVCRRCAYRTPPKD